MGWEVVGLRWHWYGVALAADADGKSDQLWKVALGGLAATALLACGFLAGTALPEPAPLMFGLGFAFNAIFLFASLVPARPFDGGHVLAGLRQARPNDPCSRTYIPVNDDDTETLVVLLRHAEFPDVADELERGLATGVKVRDPNAR